MCYMDMDRMAQRYRQLQRATVARSALDVIALIFLGCGFAFWGVAFWQLLTPPALLSLLSIQAAVLALAFSLAAPLLLSMLVPTTPAGQMLQRTQYATVGFYVILGSALFLVFQAEQLIETWLYGQPGVRELGNWRALAITLVIAFVVVPALAWIQLTPERWLQQIQQAHAVRKLEIQQSGELAIIKARMVWAKQKAAIDYANLLPLEQKEVLDTMRALFMSIGDTQRSIAGTLGISADVERTMLGDAQIIDHLDHVAAALTLPTVDLAPPMPHVDSRSQSPETRDLTVPPLDQFGLPHVDSRPVSSETREPPSDSGRQRLIVSDSVARKIAAELPRIFTAQNLADLVQQDKRTAQRTIATWLSEGMIEQVQLGRYTLIVESGT